jgi:hypothetical protein
MQSDTGGLRKHKSELWLKMMFIIASASTVVSKDEMPRLMQAESHHIKSKGQLGH